MGTCTSNSALFNNLSVYPMAREANAPWFHWTNAHCKNNGVGVTNMTYNCFY